MKAKPSPMAGAANNFHFSQQGKRLKTKKLARDLLIFAAKENEKIAEGLGSINQTLEKILGAMKKPESPFIKTLTTAGIGVGILGIIQVIDTIIKWFGG